MTKIPDQITNMAQAGLDMKDEFNGMVADVTGQPDLSSDDLVELYLNASFEQRHQMFNEIFASHGADGVKMLGEVYMKAQERYAGEVD